MATTTVLDIINQAKLILQETTTDGIRWTNQELLGWLNNGYKAFVALKPDCSAVNQTMNCVAGTRQTIPAAGVRLLDVIRNATGSKAAIKLTQRSILDSTRPNWHSETESAQLDYYVFDELDPTHFYVYPPAIEGTVIEILHASVPTRHPEDDMANDTVIKLDDRYAPALLDYILYRAYSKDADTSGNLNRAMMHKSAYVEALGGQTQMDVATSPNSN